MKATKVILMVFAILILFFGLYAYSVFYGTPWEKRKHESNMAKYLEDKYQSEFVFDEVRYNFMSESYQGYAYPKNNQNLVFIVEENIDSDGEYSDNYPKVIWESEMSSDIKEKMKELFPDLNEGTFKALQLKDKKETASLQISTYDETSLSLLTTSIPIDIDTDWEQTNQEQELEKMEDLSQFLKTVNFPVLVEIRYYDEEINDKMKIFLITEDGEIIQK